MPGFPNISQARKFPYRQGFHARIFQHRHDHDLDRFIVPDFEASAGEGEMGGGMGGSSAIELRAGANFLSAIGIRQINGFFTNERPMIVYR